MKKLILSVITAYFLLINLPIVAQYYDGNNNDFQQREFQRQQENNYRELQRQQDIMMQRQRDFQLEQEQKMKELEARSRSRNTTPGYRVDGPLR